MEHDLIPEEYRNKFTVAAGIYEDCGDVERGPKLETNYKYVERFDTLHDALQFGLPNAKGYPVQELTYVDNDGKVWELDIEPRRTP